MKKLLTSAFLISFLLTSIPAVQAEENERPDKPPKERIERMAEKAEKAEQRAAHEAEKAEHKAERDAHKAEGKELHEGVKTAETLEDKQAAIIAILDHRIEGVVAAKGRIDDTMPEEDQTMMNEKFDEVISNITDTKDQISAATTEEELKSIMEADKNKNNEIKDGIKKDMKQHAGNTIVEKIGHVFEKNEERETKATEKIEALETEGYDMTDADAALATYITDMEAAETLFVSVQTLEEFTREDFEPLKEAMHTAKASWEAFVTEVKAAIEAGATVAE
jgi:hypothetical protein